MVIVDRGALAGGPRVTGCTHRAIFQLKQDCKYKIGSQKNSRRTPNLDYTGGKILTTLAI